MTRSTTIRACQRVCTREEIGTQSAFKEIATDVRLRFSHYRGELAIDNGMAPIYYQAAAPDTPYDSIQ
ncbi:hypothetical protein LOC67_11970 [Stieleria sp. JC731]|uniref:hypothetical protein n=1 Tax=Stieleria sp. JC731 TaxID=2894195 RepID=UPI001E4CE01E|nr:hypothetical protein [Stieleria sp. JC731]MCC9601265.1 hypothetical protein [Stieleria sp. JC731]